jgi:HK97 family phage major capsid protein
MDQIELKENISLLEGKVASIKSAAARNDRRLTKDERETIQEIEDKIYEFEGQLVDGPVTVPRDQRLSSITGPFSNMGDFLIAVRDAGIPGGQVDPRLHQIRAAATGLNETVPSEGGYLLQPSMSSEILQNAFNEGELARRCRRQPIGANANGIKINGLDESSRATGSRYGGVRGYWMDEAGAKTESKPKFRQIELSLKKNIVLVYTTDELLADATALEAFIREVAPKEIAFQTDDGIINGTGAGQLLGILNSGSLVTVSKESGQAADTILAQNVIKMVKRTLGKSTNYAWYYNKSILDQIYSLSLAVGTGGQPLFMAAGSIPNQPENRLLGLPLIEIEQAAALGDLGDLILADFRNGYVLADKGGVQADMSIHVRFVYDESIFRFVYRVDGQPVLASEITPYKGGSGATQSHFIVLEAR